MAKIWFERRWMHDRERVFYRASLERIRRPIIGSESRLFFLVGADPEHLFLCFPAW